MDIYDGSLWVILVWVVVGLYGLHRRCDKQPSTYRVLGFNTCEQTSGSCHRVGLHFVLLNLRFADLCYSCSFEGKAQTTITILLSTAFFGKSDFVIIYIA